MSSKAGQRVAQAANHMTSGSDVAWDPESESFPSFNELPEIPGAPKGASWFWGKNDNLGRINLLTSKRVKKAAEEIQTGEVIPINHPLDVPKTAAFGRLGFSHEIVNLDAVGRGNAFDDHYTLNTQSGTQWDGFRHFAHLKSGLFYNGTRGDDIKGPSANDKASIEYISQHGIAGRGILLDWVTYADAKGIAWDPFEYYEISLESLQDCARSQGLDARPQSQGGDIRPGDILFVRSGWSRKYFQSTPEQREAVAKREHGTWTGLSQVGGMVEWLHDCYFAAAGGDAPAFEAWPSKHGYFLHEYMLALWGTPIGEMIDLERLSERCRETKRWTFFLTSSPANCPNGVASHVNGMAIL